MGEQSPQVSRRWLLQTASGAAVIGSLGAKAATPAAADPGTLQWTFETGDMVDSSPTVVDGTVFVGSGDDNLYAVDAETGAEQWAFETGDMVDSSPTVVDGTVFVGSRDDNLYAVDAETGAEQWAFETGDWVDSSPTVVDGTVFVGSDNNNLYAVDAETGTEQWAFETGIWITSPTVVNGWVFVGNGNSYDPNLYAVDADSGEQEWAFEINEDVASSPTVVDGTVFVGSADNNLYAMDARVNGSSEGSRVLLGTLGHHGDRADRVTTVAPAFFEVSIERVTESTAGETLDVTVTVENIGDDSNSRTVELTTSGLGTDSTTVLLDGDESTTETLSLSTDEDEAGEYTLTVDTGDDEATDTVSIAEPDSVTGDDEATDTVRIAEPDSGLGTTEIAAVGGGGGLGILFGAYVLMRRGDDDSEDDTTAEKPSEPDTSGSTTTSSAGSKSSDSSAEDAILEQQHEHLQQDAEVAITRMPATIPTTPRYSLSYDDIKKGEATGRGGNADVYYATAETNNGTVTLAVKEPRMSGTLHTDEIEGMLEEAETWQQLDDHEHIVSVIDYGSEPLPWIAMEYMDGGHLGERGGTLDIEQAIWTAISTTKAVRHAHRRGIAHLDLKPENVLFRSVEDAWDVPKVADWGLSKQLLHHSKSVEGMSPDYAAPEQFDDEYGNTDDITDVYQLGAIFYELFTGRPPYEGGSFEVMNQIRNDDPVPPSEITEVPPEIDDILLTALATDKQDRYEDVLLFRNELQDLFDSL